MSDKESDVDFLLSCIKFQRVLYSPLKMTGFVPENGSEVFVRHIPREDTEYDLLKFFRTAGEVFQVRLMMAEDGKTNRGFAYVTFSDASTARKAVATMGLLPYKGRHHLAVENSLNNCRLFIGGIPTYKRKDQVWQELFSKGVKNVIDVIMYRSYSNRAENRGFVFVEFKTHEEAAHFRAKYGKCLHLWDSPVVVDWSVPIPHVDDAVMTTVKILYLRNLDVCQSREDLQSIILNFTTRPTIEKVYKFKNYAFVHLLTRQHAEYLLEKLQDFYKNSVVEVTWAKPPSKFTTQEYRHSKVSHLSTFSYAKNYIKEYPPKNVSSVKKSTRDYGGNSTPGTSSLSRVYSLPSVYTENQSVRSLSPFESFCRDFATTSNFSLPKFSMDEDLVDWNISLRDLDMDPSYDNCSLDLQAARTPGIGTFSNNALRSNIRTPSPYEMFYNGISAASNSAQQKLSTPKAPCSPLKDSLQNFQRNMEELYGSDTSPNIERSPSSSFSPNICLQDIEILPTDVRLDDLQEFLCDIFD